MPQALVALQVGGGHLGGTATPCAQMDYPAELPVICKIYIIKSSAHKAVKYCTSQLKSLWRPQETAPFGASAY